MHTNQACLGKGEVMVYLDLSDLLAFHELCSSQSRSNFFSDSSSNSNTPPPPKQNGDGYTGIAMAVCMYMQMSLAKYF